MAKATGIENCSPRGRKRVAEAIAEEQFPKLPKIEGKTDRTRWRLRTEGGRHTWHYLDSDEAAKEWPQTNADKYNLGLPLVRRTSRVCRASTHR